EKAAHPPQDVLCRLAARERGVFAPLPGLDGRGISLLEFRARKSLRCAVIDFRKPRVEADRDVRRECTCAFGGSAQRAGEDGVETFGIGLHGRGVRERRVAAATQKRSVVEAGPGMAHEAEPERAI